MNVLELRFDLSRPNLPRVGIVVDGRATLDRGDHPMGHDPEGLLDTGALLPRETPHRVALFGCSCGDFGCSTLTALIVRRETTIAWTDITEEGGLFDSALPYGDLPDPLALGRTRPLSIVGELEFDADEYLATVTSAMTDRSWETRARAVARLMRTYLGWKTGEDGTVIAWPDEPDAVAVNLRLDGQWTTHLVPIPDGPVDQAAEALTGQLQTQPDVTAIPGARQLRL